MIRSDTVTAQPKNTLISSHQNISILIDHQVIMKTEVKGTFHIEFNLLSSFIYLHGQSEVHTHKHMKKEIILSYPELKLLLTHI